jgi:hypothetical protein
VVQGIHPGDKGGDNSPSPIILASPQEMLWEIMSWDMSLWGRLTGSNVYSASTDPADSCPKAEPWEQRGLTLYTLASRLQKKKAKLNSHMSACDFIGYFTSLVLCFNSLSFISLFCNPLPSRHQNTVYFFSDPPFLLQLMFNT